MARHADNHLKLSRKIADPVSAIGTDGKEVTSALRNDYINRAIDFIRDYVYSVGKYNNHLQGLIKYAACTFSSSQSAVPSDYAYPLSFKNSDGYKCRFIPPAEFIIVVEDKNPNYIDVYTVYGGYIHATDHSGDVITTSLAGGVIIYLSSGAIGTSDATPDIDAKWDSVIVDVAASFHWQDKQQYDFAQGQQLRTQMVLSVLNNG